MATVTVLSEREVTIPADLTDGRVLVKPADLEAATGWVLKPEGLCRVPVCVPVHDQSAVRVGAAIDLAAAAAGLTAPYATELDLGVVAFGEPAPLRSAALEEVAAPDFTLPRLGGEHDSEPFTFSSIGAKKKLLVAWASW